MFLRIWYPVQELFCCNLINRADFKCHNGTWPRWPWKSHNKQKRDAVLKTVKCSLTHQKIIFCHEIMSKTFLQIGTFQARGDHAHHASVSIFIWRKENFNGHLKIFCCGSIGYTISFFFSRDSTYFCNWKIFSVSN